MRLAKALPLHPAYRDLPHLVAKISPAVLTFGRTLFLPSDLGFGTKFHDEVDRCTGEYARELRSKLLDMHDHARQNVEIVSLKSKRYYERKAVLPTFKTGDLV